MSVLATPFRQTVLSTRKAEKPVTQTLLMYRTKTIHTTTLDITYTISIIGNKRPVSLNPQQRAIQLTRHKRSRDTRQSCSGHHQS